MTKKEATSRITMVLQEWEPEDDAIASAMVGAVYRHTIRSDESRVRAIMFQLVDEAKAIISSV